MSRHAGVGTETTYGTGVPSTVFFDLLSESLQKTVNTEELKPIRGFSTRSIVKLSEFVGGDMEVIANFQDAGIMFLHFYGQDPDTSGAGPYVHVWPPSTGLANRTNSLTAEVKRDTTAKTWRYAGCKVTGFGHTGAVDATSKFTWSLKGKSESTGTASTPSYLDFNVMKPSHITVEIDSTSIPARSFALNVGWPVDDPYILGQTTFGVEPIESDVLAVSLDVELLVTDTEMTEYAKYDGETDVDIAITITDGTHTLVYDLDKTIISTSPVNVSGRERLKTTMSFVSYYVSDAIENLKTTLTNDVSSYAL